MPEPITRYRKLPGRGALGIGFSQLWAGEDHLLAVSTLFGVERYRRFYFKDIQALVMRRTSMRLVWNAVLGGLGLIFAVIAVIVLLGSLKGGVVSQGAARGIAFGFGALAAVCIVVLVGNTLRGPTCTVFIQTTAGSDRLPALVRTKVAERMIRRIRPAIDAAQAAFHEAETAEPVEASL